VPHPPRGYWARKAAGEKMQVPPLPPGGPGDPLSWEKGVAAGAGIATAMSYRRATIAA
jgi:hypothetical protein